MQRWITTHRKREPNWTKKVYVVKLPDDTIAFMFKDCLMIVKTIQTPEEDYRRRQLYPHGELTPQYKNHKSSHCEGCGKLIKMGDDCIMLGGGSVICKPRCVTKRHYTDGSFISI